MNKIMKQKTKYSSSILAVYNSKRKEIRSSFQNTIKLLKNAKYKKKTRNEGFELKISKI
jgi:16S rRNA A1518/A1519 N6-dimethyltransferase RsmA/KsgA/DIM1 with predicted DNA glycosylase/AP lyase activity